MNLSVRTKIIVITVAVLFSALGANAAISSYVLRKEYSDALQTETSAIGQTLRLQLDKLLRLGIAIEDLVGFEKQCQDIVNAHEEISYAMVVDTNGKILFHNDPSQHGKTLTDLATLEAIKSGQDVIQVCSQEGEKHYDAIIPVLGIHGEHIAAVRIGFPAALIAQKVGRLLAYSVGVASVSLDFAIALLVSSLSVWVTKPLTRLLTVIQEIRQEGTAGLTRRVAIGSKDEIGQLGSAFNYMIGGLEHSHELIREYTEELEGLVGERTAQLSESNALLTEEIEERKRTEEALKESEERLEEMVEERTKDLREAQEQLIRREKLAVLGQLAGGVGHELRNPLSAIRSAAYFLSMALEKPEPEVKETLEILEREVALSERVISSLLDFARPKPPIRQTVDVNETLQEALSRALIPENVEISTQLEMLPTIQADPTQLGQVFQNIILNAIQAMPAGGQLTIRSKAPNPEWVAISFTDTGVGISENSLRKLFEPLFTTKARGTGLGLAVSRTLVERHGGSIEVESEVGEGSTFTVRLPIDGGGIV